MNNAPAPRALISVADKSGIIEFATGLQQLGVEILSTGGTAILLRDHDIPVQDVSDYTGFPEMMDGRLKTLHPKVHGALLGRLEQDQAIMSQHGIRAIDLLVVNLYPFSQTIKDPTCTLPEAIEQIDIGGPTMIRAGAKNHQRVGVITDPTDYGSVLQELKDHQTALTDETRYKLACKAFALTAQFDATVANYLSCAQANATPFPETLTLQFKKKMDLRYGENPHQEAAFYQERELNETCITSAHLIQGKPLSFNNIADADAALECVRQFDQQDACVIVKHANPCGVALADNQLAAYLSAFACDRTSAFGGIIAFNRPLSALTAQKIIDNQFVEVIIAPSIEQKVRNVLAEKPNVRVLTCADISTQPMGQMDYKRVNGGMLVQTRDMALYPDPKWRVVTQTKPTPAQLRDCQFAWAVAKSVKSNAIVLAHNHQTLGIGAGQMSRIDSTIIASRKANEAGFSIEGAVLASDAFFPFRDAIDTAAAAGIGAIIQPGGSLRDDEVIRAADEAGIAMLLTGMRHFRH